MPDRGDHDGAIRVITMGGTRIQGEVKGILGDYGRVIRAPHYVVLSANEAPHWLLDAGFRFEQLVLAATSDGLGTCWVGGFFHETTLRSVLGLREPARIVALCPLGVPAAKTGLVDRVLRAAIRASGRKPLEQLFSWQQAGQPLPPAVRSDERAGRLFEAIRRAPSWANRQPWRFVVRPDEILLLKHGRQMKEGKDYHRVDCGIALAHLDAAARALGIDGDIALEPEIEIEIDLEPVARYRFRHAPFDRAASCDSPRPR